MNAIHAVEAILNPDRIIALLTLIVAAVGAYYAFRAPDKRDLKRVEDHAAATSAHLERQRQLDENNSAASRVYIAVEGRNFQDEPLEVHLRLQDPSVRLTRIDMLNAVETLYGGGSCVMQEPDHYVAELDSRKVRNWVNAGEHYGTTSHLWLRVYMSFEEGGRGSKKMPVVILPSQVGTERRTGPVWQLSGEV
jgi:hypothetical protein